MKSLPLIIALFLISFSARATQTGLSDSMMMDLHKAIGQANLARNSVENKNRDDLCFKMGMVSSLLDSTSRRLRVESTTLPSSWTREQRESASEIIEKYRPELESLAFRLGHVCQLEIRYDLDSEQSEAWEAALEEIVKVEDTVSKMLRELRDCTTRKFNIPGGLPILKPTK